MKGQITVFIIIGLLVVIAFGITLYAGSKMRQTTQAKETQQQMQQLGIQPIQEYITTCLTLAASQGLALIGRQGGAIYQSQGGLTPDFKEGDNYAKYTDPELGTLNVPYLIMPPEGNVDTLFYSEPPLYPFETFPHIPGQTEPLFTGYYGTSKLPTLYKTSAQTGEKVQGSIQESLEEYIAKQTPQCTDWKTFDEKGYKITAKTPTASLIFATKQEQFAGEQYIGVELLWPIEITTPTGDKSILKDFAIKIPVRLATIYYTTKRIIDTDVTDISYAPENTEAFTIITVPYEEDSIIIAKDAQSTIENKQAEFWMPRKNRRPALWQINTEPLQQITFHVTPEGRGAKITAGEKISIDDPCQEEGTPNPYELEINATDPDENEIIYDVYIPESTNNELPLDATEREDYSITIYAKDKSDNPRTWFDSQTIPIKVALCEVR